MDPSPDQDDPLEEPATDPEESQDPDRRAILRRRQRFISIALSGLAAGSLASCKPCLKTVTKTKGDKTKTETTDKTDKTPDKTGEPQVCLKVRIDDKTKTEPEPDKTKTGPKVCLKVRIDDKTKTEPEPDKTKTGPKPCLKISRPGPCLRVRRPPPPKKEDDGN